jgi:hypothetical protein
MPAAGCLKGAVVGGWRGTVLDIITNITDFSELARAACRLGPG